MPFLTKDPEEEPRSTTSWLRGRQVPYGARKTNWKFITIILILAILVSGGILGYLRYFEKEMESFTEFPEIKRPEKVVEKQEEPKIKDETVNWKTYRNEEYGFEFKYPPIPAGCEYCKIHESEDSFSVNTTSLVIEDLKELTLFQFVDKVMKESEFEIGRKEKIIIGGKEGIKVNYRFGGMGRFGSAAFVEKDGKVFIMKFTAGGFCCNPSVDIIYESEVYDAILSTFRFLEGKSSGEKPYIRVLLPNGEEKWVVRKTYQIQAYCNFLTSIDLWLITSVGGKEIDIAQIASNLPCGPAGPRGPEVTLYNWTIPSSLQPTGLLESVKIVAHTMDGKFRDESDNYFSIVAPTTSLQDTKN